MQKNDQQYVVGVEPTCKKIQNYIFKFSDMLGKGNFSKVYKAHNQLTNQVVAIKIIELNSLKSKKLQELLFSEIDVLKKLNHPNILQCYEVFTSNRNCYIITELCNEGDLQSKLRKKRHFNQQQAQHIIRDVFCGLHYLAQRNVIHRDLKVANIFLHNGRAKIADFGFAKFTKQRFKDINIGSPIYMSPEGLINNYYGPKTDIWAFGVLIYELLHGQTPYAFCQTESQLKYHISISLTWNKLKPELSTEIKELILMCMEVSQQKRVTTADLMKNPYIKSILQKFGDSNINFVRQKSGFQSPTHSNLQNLTSNSHFAAQSKSPFKNNTEDRSRRNLMTMQPNDRRSSPLNVQNHRNLSSKNIKRNDPSYASNNTLDRRGISAEKFGLLKQSEQQQNTVSKRSFLDKVSIISASITFKQCVNILHYCRLIYKYTTTLKQSPYTDQNQIKTFARWLMKVLREINQKIDKKNIIYEGDNVWLREKKLKEVATQYSKKYTSQLGQQTVSSSNDLTLSYMKQYCHSVFQHFDNILKSEANRSLLIIGHSIVMIDDCTKLLKKCHDEQNYKAFSHYKDVQAFLNMSKDNMDLHSYALYRKKLSFK